MKWFRMYSDAVQDSKLKLLAFEDRWHFVAVLCMKASGLIDSGSGELRERRIAVDLGLTLREAEEVKRRLREVGLIDSEWNPLAWGKRQYEHDDAAKRMREYRERKKSADSSEPLRNGDVTVTGTDTDTDTDTDKRKGDEYAADFVTFWAEYPNKSNKAAAYKAWRKLKPSAALTETILVDIASRDWKPPFIPHAGTYLNNKRWEDEREVLIAVGGEVYS